MISITSVECCTLTSCPRSPAACLSCSQQGMDLLDALGSACGRPRLAPPPRTAGRHHGHHDFLAISGITRLLDAAAATGDAWLDMPFRAPRSASNKALWPEDIQRFFATVPYKMAATVTTMRITPSARGRWSRDGTGDGGFILVAWMSWDRCHCRRPSWARRQPVPHPVVAEQGSQNCLHSCHGEEQLEPGGGEGPWED